MFDDVLVIIASQKPQGTIISDNTQKSGLMKNNYSWIKINLETDKKGSIRKGRKYSNVNKWLKKIRVVRKSHTKDIHKKLEIN